MTGHDFVMDTYQFLRWCLKTTGLVHVCRDEGRGRGYGVRKGSKMNLSRAEALNWVAGRMWLFHETEMEPSDWQWMEKAISTQTKRRNLF